MMSQSGSVSDALCCCEYIDEGGERAHVLSCCCDCQALDDACDRCIRCQPVPKHVHDKMCSTITDRLRIPWCNGRGAIRVSCDAIAPAVIIPSCLIVGTLNPYMTALMLTLLPCCMFLYYRAWVRQHNRRRTKLYVSWLLFSIAGLFIFFEWLIVPLQKLSEFGNIFIICGVCIGFVSIFLAAKDAGFIQKGTSNDSNYYSNVNSDTMNSDLKRITSQMDKVTSDSTKAEFESKLSSTIEIHPIGNFLMKNCGFTQHAFAQDFEASLAPVIPEEQVTWVDSRPIKNGQLVTWCETCAIVRPPRAGHCDLCEACVLVRDHHCVWLDICIGAKNHRSFLVALVTFIACGCYGSHITLQTVCEPSKRKAFINLLTDCMNAYDNFYSALCYVGAVYAIIAIIVLSIVLLQQIIFISQNVTSQEIHRASHRGQLKCLYFAKSNIHNRGLIRNWWTFIWRGHRVGSSDIPY